MLDPSLFRIWGNSSGRNADPVVATLWGRKYRQSDINEMKIQRGNANMFMAQLVSFDRFFGDLSTRSIVDAIVLEHEADALKMPRNKEVAQEWLRKLTDGKMTGEIFDSILARFNNRISGEQILDELANQIRIMNVQGLLGRPVVTPLDVYRAYRDQNERVSARAAEFRVDEYVNKVKDPSDSEVRAYYDKYKDKLPDPALDAPGFKVPRQVRVEILSIDSAALARSIQQKLTDSELRSYYENRKSDFEVFSEFPRDVFADDPKATLTPPLVRPFAEIRPSLAISLAEEKAQAEISDRFNKLKEDVLFPFYDKYHTAKDEIEEAKKQGEATKTELPRMTDLKGVAEKEHLEYDMTPLLTREQAESYGQIHDAEYGTTRFSGGRKFAAELFDPKANLFDSVELTSPDGRRFLVRKVEDDAPRVPPSTRSSPRWSAPGSSNRRDRSPRRPPRSSRRRSKRRAESSNRMLWTGTG